MSLIRIENLTHFYHSPGQPPFAALRDVSLAIEPGEYVAIVGPNGSGKTTLARHLNALLLPSQGRVWIDGHSTADAEALRAIRATVGMVFQSPADQIVATVVQEDVAFGPENLGVPHDQLPRVVRSALERVGMWEERLRPPHMLSAGQQQRVAIAGTLAMNPRCLVFDEATAMLDPAARRDVLQIMADLHRAGITIIDITHDMAQAAAAGRVIVMQAGQVAMDAPPHDVFASGRLGALGLALPPAAALAHRLHLHFPAIPADILTLDQLVQATAGL